MSTRRGREVAIKSSIFDFHLSVSVSGLLQSLPQRHPLSCFFPLNPSSIQGLRQRWVGITRTAACIELGRRCSHLPHVSPPRLNPGQPQIPLPVSRRSPPAGPVAPRVPPGPPRLSEGWALHLYQRDGLRFAASLSSLLAPPGSRSAPPWAPGVPAASGARGRHPKGWRRSQPRALLVLLSIHVIFFLPESGDVRKQPSRLGPR